MTTARLFDLAALLVVTVTYIHFVCMVIRNLRG